MSGVTARHDYVLVIDDEDEIRELLAEVLVAHGYRVVSAASGAEALALMRSLAPVFVVMDLMMPRMSGWDLAAIMGADPDLQGIPYCVVSAATDPPSPSPPPGAVAVFRKPLRTDALLDRLRQTLGPSR
jgi:CheY-like chemotaxis protein